MATKTKGKTKKRNQKTTGKRSAAKTAVVEDDEEDDAVDIEDVDLEDGIEDDEELDEVEDDEEDDDEEDEAEDDEAEDEEDDDEPEAEADESGEDAEDEETNFAVGFDVLNYEPGEITPSIVRDPASPEVKEMVKSIRKNGLINPIVIGSDCVIIAGNTRYAALVAIGRKEIPARQATDASTGEYIDSESFSARMQTLAENINRSVVSPLEQGAAFRKLLDDKLCDTESEIAKHLGLSPKTVGKYISLVNRATPELTSALQNDQITSEAALTILQRSKDADEIDELLSATIAASKGKRASTKTAKAEADTAERGKTSKRGRPATRRNLSDEAFRRDETSISAVLQTDRDEEVFHINIAIVLDHDMNKKFTKADIPAQIIAAAQKLDAKEIRAELEAARKALMGEE